MDERDKAWTWIGQLENAAGVLYQIEINLPRFCWFPFLLFEHVSQQLTSGSLPKSWASKGQLKDHIACPQEVGRL
eukprot:1157461-Pelagomonas_calceolata.AAC.6